MAIRSPGRSAGRRARRIGQRGAQSTKALGQDSFDGLYFPGLGQPLLDEASGIRTFEQADRVLSMFLGRPVSTDASLPGRA